MKPFYIDTQHPFHKWVLDQNRMFSRQLNDKDICWYTRLVIKTILLTIVKLTLIVSGLAVVVTLLCIVGLSVIDDIFGIKTVYWYWMPLVALASLVACVIIVACMFCVFWIFVEGIPHVFRHARYKARNTITPSFVSQAYDSWKNKYCMKITTTKE